MSRLTSSLPTSQLSYTNRFRLFTPKTAFLAIYLSLAALNFGYDVGIFSGVQAMSPFRRRFGELNEKTGKWALASYMQSIMNSLPFFGKLIGCWTCGWVAERFGRRVAMLTLALISLVGVTLQTSAFSAAQFVLGRVINFGMTGFVVVLAPIYQAECFPAPLRGMISATIQFQIGLGGLIASLVNLGTADMMDDAAWRIPVGLQYIVPIVILAFWTIMPESPRWLIARGRTAEAVASLKLLRKADTSEEMIATEIQTLSSFNSNEGKGPWKEVFSKLNRRRTWIAIITMFFQQSTGQAFVSQYAVVFYQQQGVSDPFLMSVIGSVVALICTIIASLLVDAMGRRPLLCIGGTSMAFFIFMVGGIGTIQEPSANMKNLLVASVMLFGGSYGVSWASVSYVILGEVAASRVKEKTNQLAVAISVLTTFVVSFTIPYLLNAPYANLGAKVGFIYGSICVVSVICAFLFVPEMKGRSLEEIDQLFAGKVPAWRSRSFRPAVETTGLDDEELGQRKSLEKPTTALEEREVEHA